jgi:hypothetical protein
VLRNILFAGVTLAAGSAGATPQRPTFHHDGSLTVGNHVYSTNAEYLGSQEFRDSGARCGADTIIHSSLVANPSECSDSSTTIDQGYNDGRTLVIQVIFHVIKKTDGTGDIDPSLLKSQIDVLNEDYEAMANTLGSMGNNTKIKFVLARYDPMGNPTPGYEIVTNDSYYTDPGGGLSPMKSALHWDSSKYFNVYTNDCAGYLGYATFPWDQAGSPAEDGVVLVSYAVGRNAPNGGEYNLGRTLTHESGHWLGLYHPFQDGCTGTDNTAYTTADLIKDTPRDNASHFSCAADPTDATKCPGQTAPIENYMEYTPDACMTKFTVEQADRIRCSAINYRWIDTEPTAGFTFTSDQLVTAFTSTSTDAETTDATLLHYNWDFGDGMTGTDQNPMHTYAAAGSYTVTLEVVDPGSASSTSMQTVVVADAGGGGGSGGSNTGGGGGDAGLGGGGGEGGAKTGGCCSANGGDLSFLLAGAPLAFLLRRRRRG